MAFNNGPRLVTEGLDLLVDAADPTSYPGSGTTWRDLRSTITGSLTGSVAYTSEFYGGLTFSNSSSAVIFPSTVANYGSGSFTVEMAFKPTFINGRHYLMSKNSGSFPNWSIYLSGSNGSGKLFSEFRITSAISCSVSSSTVFVTGSVYQVDVRMVPASSASGFYVNGQSEGGALGNGGGSLSTTSSLFVGNFSQNNTQNFSGSIYTVKTYNIQSLSQPSTNYSALSTRLGNPKVVINNPVFELLVVAGGGSGGTVRNGGNNSGGGGAGGLQHISSFTPQAGITTVIVGAGGARSGDTSPGNQGQNSVFGTYVSIGGGRGGQYSGGSGGDGGSGGGSGGGAAGLGTPGQGNNGSSAGGGGGGGAGSAAPAGTYTTRPGGSGSYIASFAAIGGSPAGWFAGGGGGSDNVAVTYFFGGIGGGGTGSFGLPGGIPSVSICDGITNTGGGGGGVSGLATTPYIGSLGGSGIVAIRYSGPPIALGGQITQSAGYTYHVYRTVGTSSFTIF